MVHLYVRVEKPYLLQYSVQVSHVMISVNRQVSNMMRDRCPSLL